MIGVFESLRCDGKNTERGLGCGSWAPGQLGSLIEQVAEPSRRREKLVQSPEKGACRPRGVGEPVWLELSGQGS